MTASAEILLRQYAAQYETKDFLTGDPSCFMHMVSGEENQEAMAYVASALSYGSRQQFLPKIDFILQQSGGEVCQWLVSSAFERDFSPQNSSSFYRLYSFSCMHSFLYVYSRMLLDYGSLGGYLHAKNVRTGMQALEAVTSFFASNGSAGVVPKDTSSCCKRLCMFLRWMVRSGSPVDLGLWADMIDRRTLVIPLDTHVLQQALRLGLVSSKTTSMTAAVKLTEALAEVFPDDPLKGDFALFGYGVNNSGKGK